jgi:hypothetical protein
MPDVDLEVSGKRVVIDFRRLAPGSEALAERVRDVLPVLIALVSADSAWRSLTEEERRLRANARSAIDMKTQATLLFAQAQAELLVAIIDGSESIADHGFPEFLDGQSQDD